MDLVVAPTLVAFNSPPLKIIMVGILFTPYLVGVLGSWSKLCFAITTWSFISSDISSSVGAICLQGPLRRSIDEPTHFWVGSSTPFSPKIYYDHFIGFQDFCFKIFICDWFRWHKNLIIDFFYKSMFLVRFLWKYSFFFI